MADPLTLLRQFNSNKREIQERDDQIVFGEFAYLKNVKTNYMVYKAGESATKDYYTLEALHFLLKNVSIPHPIYVQKAAAAKVPVVNRVDRKALLAYLNGDTDTSASIDKSAPLELGASRSAPAKRPNESGDGSEVKKARIELADVQGSLEKTAAKYTVRAEPAIGGVAAPESGSTISEAISVETIAAIKAKRFAKKRSTIRGVNEEEAPVAAPLPEPRGNFLDSQIDVSRDIVSKERSLRNRNNVLQSVGRTFTNILSILQVKSRAEPSRAPSNNTSHHQEEKGRQMPPKSYSRYDQERFRAEKETEEFKIDTLGGFASMKQQNTPAAAPSSSSNNRLSSHSQHQQKDRSNSGHPRSVAQAKNPKRESKTPIVIVPASISSLINLYNVRDFLQDNRFVTAREKEMQGYRKQNEVTISRKRDLVEMNALRGHAAPVTENQIVTVPYRIVDNPLRLERKDWERVVAVFVAGPAWQFKGWPGLLPDGSPVNIFTKMKAFHLKFEEVAMDKNVLKWDVTLLTVSKNKRHLDSVSALKFWEELDRFIVKNKRHLRF